MTRWVLALLVALSATAATGCATDSTAIREASSPAERAYLQGRQDLEDSDYRQALERFNHVRNEYPYSRFSALAELGMADTYYEQNKFASAVEQYRGFVQLHPEHQEIPYARFRIARAYYEQMPDEWFFTPPAHERDLTKVKSAVRELNVFLDRYPNSEYSSEAEQLLRRARRVLADHEMYVAEFYLDRDNPRAASMRLRYLLQNYSGVGLDPDALFLLAKSYVQLGDVERAVTALQDLIDVHPNSEQADKAREYLAEIQGG